MYDTEFAKEFKEEIELDEMKWAVGGVYHQEFKNGDKAYFRADSVQKNKRWKGMQVDEFGGRQKKAKNATANENLPGWVTTPKNEIPKGLKEEVEVDEAKMINVKLPAHLAKFFDKKGNPKPEVAARIRKARALKGVKITDVTPDWMFPNEEVEATRMPMSAPFVLSDGVTGPTRMQVQKAFDKEKGLLRVRINNTEKGLKIRDLKVDAKGTVQSFKEEVEEARSKEDELELAKAIAAFKKKGGKIKKLALLIVECYFLLALN